jgi:hypothetical protein
MRYLLLFIFACFVNESVAQTIPKERLIDFVACVPVSKSGWGQVEILANSFQEYSFASSDAEQNEFSSNSGCYNRFNRLSAIMVGICKNSNNRSESFRKSVLFIPELNKTVTLMNDCFGHEGQSAVLAIWVNKKDSLTLDFIIKDPILTGIGIVYLEEYVLFRDSSILVVARKISEGYAHIVFIQITSDHKYQYLYESPTYYELGDNFITKDAKDRAYRIKRPFTKYQSALIPELKRITLDNSDLADVIKEGGRWISIDLWKLVQKHRDK